MRPRSHMLKHYVNSHMNIKLEEMKFKMRVVKRYRSAFERQIGESIYINSNLRKGFNLLNSKNEYNRCSLPRLGISLSMKDELVERYEEEKEERKLKEKISKLVSKLRMNKGENQPREKRRKLDKENSEKVIEGEYRKFKSDVISKRNTVNRSDTDKISIFEVIKES